MKKLLLALLLVAAGTALADDRLGFATHFDQGQNAGILAPLITPTGAAFARDDFGWSGLEHTAKGVYGMYSGKLAWIKTLHDNGVKIVACVQAGGAFSPSSSWYPNPFDVTGYANACAWLAAQRNADGTRMVDAIEVLNEPNNNPFRGYYGSLWRERLSELTTAATNAVHAIDPTLPVIGLGIQGSDIQYCINYGAISDGIVFHPYDLGDNIPEHNYEPPYNDYQSFMTAMRSWTKLPLWTTEQNISTGSQTDEEVWDARRLLLAFGLGVEHTFLYDFCDSSAQGITDASGHPKLTYYMIRDRLMPVMTGTRTLGSVITVTAHDANWDAADFKGLLFDHQPSGNNRPNVAAVWFGNHPVATAITPSKATLSFPGQWTAHLSGQSTVVNLITGTVTPIIEAYQPNPNNAPQWSTPQGPIKNITVSDQPILIIVK